MSGLNSWGAYLLASVALVALLAPALTSAAGATREGADWRTADGVRRVIASLSPGETVNLTLWGAPGADPMVLSGRTITCTYGKGSITMSSPWLLPGVTLSAGVSYSLTLSRGAVRVVRGG